MTPRAATLPFLPRRLAGAALALALLGRVALGAAEKPAPPPPAPTVEQVAALKGLDAAIDRFAARLEKDEDPPHRTAGIRLLEEFKSRRDALRRAFDQARYDELRWDVNVEYQRLVKWLAAPALPPSRKAPRSSAAP